MLGGSLLHLGDEGVMEINLDNTVLCYWEWHWQSKVCVVYPWKIYQRPRTWVAGWNGSVFQLKWQNSTRDAS